MTPEYILRKSLCRPPFCGPYDESARINEIENVGLAGEYGEPGYSNPKRGILFANWNKFCCEVTDLLERAGYEIERSDEWTTCGNCGVALRTSPDRYS